jgi:ABC-type transport system involved in cytochrome c biogenesis permease subunit
MEDTKTIQCPYCKELIIEGAIKCKHCGSDLTKPAQSSEAIQKSNVAGFVALIGGALLIIGLLLPWMTAGVFSVSAFQKVGDAYIFLIFGIAISLLAIVGIIQKKSYGIVIVIFSLLSLAYLTYLYFQLIENVGMQGGFSPQIGSGFYMSAIGAFIALVGGAMMAQKPKKAK